jgi:Protein of unknown function (DUF3617)
MAARRVDRRTRHPPARHGRFALLGALLVSGLACARADDYPTFTPGQWRLSTTMDVDGKQGTRETTHCGDPTQGMRAIFTPGSAAPGCQSSAPKQEGNRYSITSDCGTRGHSRIEVTVHSKESFTQVIETRIGKSTVHETMEARRIGACAK